MHPASLSPADVAQDLALYREKFQQRLPAALEELRGPVAGVVELPVHVAWSGMRAYDLGKPRQRMGLYRTVLHEGLREDLPRYLNHDLLLRRCHVVGCGGV
ncbi:hypothetical protein [Streptomyces sp. MMBL 11-3]|uniref:hypothetical protein n=1 Tax=Streptomyces sp. MMBL 11-3 TaxID=3382639 RepID=UPI0039B45BF5